MNATVTISLLELDQIRNNLKDALSEVSDLKNKTASAQVLVTEVSYQDEWVNEPVYRISGPSYEIRKKTVRKEIQNWHNLDEVSALIEEKEKAKQENFVQALKNDLRYQTEKGEEKDKKIHELENQIRGLEGKKKEETHIEELEREISELKEKLLASEAKVAELEAAPPRRGLFSSWFK